MIFRVGDGERVVSVARLPDVSPEENGENGEEAGTESEEGEGK